MFNLVAYEEPDTPQDFIVFGTGQSHTTPLIFFIGEEGPADTVVFANSLSEVFDVFGEPVSPGYTKVWHCLTTAICPSFCLVRRTGNMQEAINIVSEDGRYPELKYLIECSEYTKDLMKNL